MVHDANGSITQDGSTTYTWDVRGRLTQVTSGGNTYQFTYDCFNRRVTKSVNGVVKRYVWLGDDLAVEADASWNVLASYFYQPGVDAPISRTSGGSTVYYLQDNASSVTALANASGSILGRYYYGPFGDLVSQDAGLPSQPLMWTGRELDETGLYYLRGRYYSPTLGRFLSEDPAGLSANLNLYLFALNNPVGSSDPFGACANSGSSDAAGADADDDGDPFHNPVVKLPGDMTDWEPPLTDGEATGWNKAKEHLHNHELPWLMDTYENVTMTMVGMYSGGRWGGGGGGGPRRVRHYTTKEGFEGIKRDMAIRPSRWDPVGVDVEVAPFGPARGAKADLGCVGDTHYVEFDAPEGMIGTDVGPRNTGRIPSDRPLPIGDLNPRFVKPPWWKFW